MEWVFPTIVISFFYFIPTITALAKKHPHPWAIFIFNFLLGFTIFGWFGAMYFVGKAKRPGVGVYIISLGILILYVMMSLPGYRVAKQNSIQALKSGQE